MEDFVGSAAPPLESKPGSRLQPAGDPLPARTRIAIAAGRLGSRLSKLGGDGGGTAIGGRLAVRVDPLAPRRLARGRTVGAGGGAVRGIKDMAPLWDAPLEDLAGCIVVVSGQRRRDLAARLEVAGVEARVVEDPLEAVRGLPPGPVHVVANQTAFLGLRRRLPP